MCENKREEQLKITRGYLCPNPNITKPYIDNLLQQEEILSWRDEQNISLKSIKEMMLRNAALRYTEEDLKALRDKNELKYYYLLDKITELKESLPPASNPIDIPKKETEAEDFWSTGCYPY